MAESHNARRRPIRLPQEVRDYYARAFAPRAIVDVLIVAALILLARWCGNG